MNGNHEPLCLRKGEIVRTRQVGRRIACRRGKLWITQTGLAQDVILIAGQTFEPRPFGLLVIEALEAACLGCGAATTNN